MASCSGGSSGGGDLTTLPSSSAAAAREELKSQFCTREGVYRLVTALELSRTATRSMMPPISYGSMTPAPSNPNSPPNGPCPPLRLSFVNILEEEDAVTSRKEKEGSPKSPSQANDNNGGGGTVSGNSSSSSVPGQPHPRLCFNLGKELFVYSFLGCRMVVDIGKPIDKRVYKGTFPTCHEFNPVSATEDNLSLLIGFSGGQIQLVDPVSKEVNKLFNEDRLIDKTRVTCIRWVPGSGNMFLVSHGSGHTYLYNSELGCGTTAPHYQTLRQGPGYSVSNCKSKALRNPITRWSLGEGATNEFAFSPCGLFLAIVSQDGFLRIFRYDNHDLVGITRSYFGGLLCVGWSPDCKYICVGGEDDLVTVWSFKERRVVARGQGHKSWVSVVAFDPYTTTYGDIEAGDEGCVNADACNHNHIGGSPPGGNDCQSSGVFSCDSTSTTLNSQSNCVSCQANNGSGGHSDHSPTSSSSPSNPKTFPPSKPPSQLSVNVNHNHSAGGSNTVDAGGGGSGLKNFLANRQSRTSESGGGMRLSVSEASAGARARACYRVGSVGQDTQFCLWDLTEDVLTAKQPFGSKSRPGTAARPDSNSISHVKSNNNSKQPPPTGNCVNASSHFNSTDKDVVDSVTVVVGSGSGGGSRSNSTPAAASDAGKKPAAENGTHGVFSLRFGALGFGSSDKSGTKGEHKRNFSLGSSSKLLDKSGGGGSGSGGSGSNSNSGGSKSGGSLDLNLEDPLRLIGTQACPRLDECPLLEPLICKKISHERLTTLIFREESIVTACQDGVVCTWARPGEEFRTGGFGSGSGGGAGGPPTRTKVTMSGNGGSGGGVVPEDIFNRLYHKASDPMEPL